MVPAALSLKMPSHIAWQSAVAVLIVEMAMHVISMSPLARIVAKDD